MSAYPSSSSTYTQVAYPPTQPYPVPHPPPHAYYAAPVPQPVYLDPHTFRRDYMARLANLTVNSRPIIQSLSVIAQDYSRFAEIVVQCVEQHIRRIEPSMKLPAFYLLDAISKNVYDPYARQFAVVVAGLFKDTYDVVDQNTRGKMEEMLLTWRTGAPNGRELFGVVPQRAIEGHVWAGGSNQTTALGRSRGANSQSMITQARVLSELEFVLGQKERQLQANPYDRAAQNHIAVLQQLRGLVQAGVSQQELSDILSQLHALAAPPPVASPPPPAPIAQQYIAPSYSSPPPIPPAPQPTYPTQPSFPAGFNPSALAALLPSQPAVSTTVAPPSAVPDISNLFSALVKAGVVSASSTPTGAGSSSKLEGSTPPVDPEREAANAYRNTILSMRIKLTSSDIAKHRPPMADLLYNRLAVQCKQCGVRYEDTPTGKKLLEEHMDMHFRQNRKASQAVGRGHSRSWFVTMEDWIHGDSHDFKGKGRADGRSTTSKAAAAQEAAQREAELRAMFVVVPRGDEAKAISCPICKEPLKSEFLEEDEDWVWRNAIKKDDWIFHATCHAEASAASKSALAARLRNDTDSHSRPRTPESRRTPPRPSGDARKSETPTPSKLAGLKRKAEEDGAGTVRNDGDVPQVKRVAT